MEAVSSQRDVGQAYAHLYERMVDDVSFLWLLRSLAVNRPAYYTEDLAELDLRIQAQLDALMSSPEQSWEWCVSALEFQQPGEMFTASIVAFRSLDVKKIQHVVETASTDERLIPALISALACLPGKRVNSWVKKFLTSKDLSHKYIAIAASSVRREDPGEILSKILNREDCIANVSLYARCMRLIGELKRRDLGAYLAAGMASENIDVKFWAVWSAILLGDKNAVSELKPYVMSDGDLKTRAIDVAFRVLSIDEGRQWISELAKDPANQRIVIYASGVFGDPHVIDWLVQQMANPVSTRIAGEAFSNITGVNLDEHKLALDELPNLDELLPEESAEDVELDDDEDLPFPDIDKVSAVWQKYKQRFVSGQRYFMGQPPSADYLSHIYSVGNQRQRRAAALELSLLQPARYLLNHAVTSIGDQ